MATLPSFPVAVIKPRQKQCKEGQQSVCPLTQFKIQSISMQRSRRQELVDFAHIVYIVRKQARMQACCWVPDGSGSPAEGIARPLIKMGLHCVN